MNETHNTFIVSIFSEIGAGNLINGTLRKLKENRNGGSLFRQRQPVHN